MGQTPLAAAPGSGAAVHPHACGADDTPAGRDLVRDGSSPRVWGGQRRQQRRHRRLRFIPTRVGRTPPAGRSDAATPVHPHACGADDRPADPSFSFTGSSPRVWGGLDLLLRAHQVDRGSSPRVWGGRPQLRVGHPELRFIPTRVGRTAPAPPGWPTTPVHPHACGADPMDGPVWWGRVRFIPTRVGRTPCSRAQPVHRSVHPHACGADT